MQEGGLRSDDLHQDTFDEISTGDVDVKTVAAVFHASLQHLEKTIIQAAKIIDYLDKLKLPDDHTKQERNAFKSSQIPSSNVKIASGKPEGGFTKYSVVINY